MFLYPTLLTVSSTSPGDFTVHIPLNPSTLQRGITYKYVISCDKIKNASKKGSVSSESKHGGTLHSVFEGTTDGLCRDALMITTLLKTTSLRWGRFVVICWTLKLALCQGLERLLAVGN